jgi:hypothetical protein
MNFVLAFLIIAVGGFYWMARTEDACWKHEATQAFQKYGSLKARSDILRVVGTEKDPGPNPVEVVEKEPNGCSLGSNGRTVLRFSFDDGKLTTIQVFRDYIASDPNYKMELIEERKF